MDSSDKTATNNRQVQLLPPLQQPTIGVVQEEKESTSPKKPLRSPHHNTASSSAKSAAMASSYRSEGDDNQEKYHILGMTFERTNIPSPLLLSLPLSI